MHNNMKKIGLSGIITASLAAVLINIMCFMISISEDTMKISLPFDCLYTGAFLLWIVAEVIMIDGCRRYQKSGSLILFGISALLCGCTMLMILFHDVVMVLENGVILAGTYTMTVFIILDMIILAGFLLIIFHYWYDLKRGIGMAVLVLIAAGVIYAGGEVAGYSIATCSDSMDFVFALGVLMMVLSHALIFQIQQNA